jgi:hypothetical protein
MSKHVIFLLHGMGKHEKGWSADAQNTLRESYQSYAKLTSFPFDDHFAFVELNYDFFFETLREEWKKDSDPLLNILEAKGVDSNLLPIIADLGGSTIDNNFFNTHILDVILYYFISLVRIPVRTDLGTQQIPEALKDDGSGTEVSKWSIICHSLGTIVGHDTLHAMFEPNNPVRLNPGNRGPSVGLFVANVGRLLQSDFDVYQSMTRPSLHKSNGIFDYYLNSHHRLDPIPKPKPFKPPHEWLDGKTRQASTPRFLDIEITEVENPNVHDLVHYLRNPKVHIPFFRALWNRQSMVSQTEEKRAIDEFDNHLPINSKLDAVKQELQKLTENGGMQLGDFLKTAKAFYEILKQGQ